MIRSQFCTCHDSWAAVACAKLWPDCMYNIKIRRKIIHKIWVTSSVPLCGLVTMAQHPSSCQGILVAGEALMGWKGCLVRLRKMASSICLLFYCFKVQEVEIIRYPCDIHMCDWFLTMNFFNSTFHVSANMCLWTGALLVQVMACRLVGAKPLSQPVLMYYQLDPWGHTSVWNLNKV